MLNDRLHPSDFRNRDFWVRRPPMPPNAPPMAALAGLVFRFCIEGLSPAATLASPASDNRPSSSCAPSALLESFSFNIILPPIGMMCLIEVQKYEITERLKNSSAQKRNSQPRHCEFFVSCYKTKARSKAFILVKYSINYNLPFLKKITESSLRR